MIVQTRNAQSTSLVLPSDPQRQLSPALHFVWSPPDWLKIAQDWCALEKVVQPDVFLTWDWVATWQDVYSATEYVSRVYEGDRLVAIGLWALKHHQRPFGFHVKTLHLQHCGDDAKDQIWSEYNELLCLPEYREAVYQRLLKHLPPTESVNEVDLGVCDQVLAPWLCRSGWLAEQRWSTVSIAVDLTQWSTFQDYLSSLSKSFQYQLRRTQKGLERAGTVTLKFAPDAASCCAWFHEDGQWHKAQWGKDSGFENPEFVAFHRAWIQRAFPDNHCHYARLMVGDTVAAGIYLLAAKNTWYFYLGFSRDDWGAKVKTGYYLHLKIIERCFELGVACYDFMGGDYPYKHRFGKPQRVLIGNRYKPAHWLNRCEQCFKWIKHLMRSNEGKTVAPDA